jgi:hypothetical protein
MTNTSQIAEAVAGRAMGVFFVAGFGSIWMCTGLAALGHLTLLSGIGILIVLAALVLPAVQLLRKTRKYKVEEADPERSRRIGRAFGWINTVQWIAIVAAIVLLNVFRQPDYIVPAIATIVGLHMLPLARLFEYPAHYLAGGLLVAYSAATVLWLPKQQIPGPGAAGTAVILFATAANSLLSAERAARRLP